MVDLWSTVRNDINTEGRNIIMWYLLIQPWGEIAFEKHNRLNQMI